MGLLNVLKDFAGGTSIHGLKYLAQTQLSTLTRVTWAYVFLTAIIYASYQLKLAVICKSYNLIQKLTSNNVITFILAWDEIPISSKTLVYPIKKAEMPTVTLCPKNMNPDRWGPTIKIFDYLDRKCSSKKYVLPINNLRTY